MKRNAKVDFNQPHIVKELRKRGAAVLHTHQLKNAFDILVGYKGKLYICEIKTDKRYKLTEGEQRCKETFNAVDVPYYVITSADDLFKHIEE